MEEETIDLPADNIEDKKEKIRKLVGEGYTNREIADRTGIPFGTVGYHAARFRKKEKERLYMAWTHGNESNRAAGRK